MIDGYRAKDGSRRANGRDITFADGRKMFMGSSGTGAPYELTPGSSEEAVKRRRAQRPRSVTQPPAREGVSRGWRALGTGPLLPRRMIG